MIKKKQSSQSIVLDTHIWLWLVAGHEQLKSSEILKRIKKFTDDDFLYIPAISIWEVAMLESKNRIALPVACNEWIQTALNVGRIRLAPLTPDIAIQATRLPGECYVDPADRMIIATAMKLNYPLATFDSSIIQYAKKHNLEIIT